jgi:hypothetical protein
LVARLGEHSEPAISVFPRPVERVEIDVGQLGQKAPPYGVPV